jgi:outer membrane receptor for Fe3+-dicitrate
MSKKKSKTSIHQRIFDIGFFLVALWAVFNIWLNLGYVCTEIKITNIDMNEEPNKTYVSYEYDGTLRTNVVMPNYRLTEDESATGKKLYAYLSKSNENVWFNRDLVEILHFAILPGILFIIIGYCFDEKNLKRIQDRNTDEVMAN